MMNLAPVNNALERLRDYDKCIRTIDLDLLKTQFDGDDEFGAIIDGDRRLNMTKASVVSLSKLLKLSASYIRDASPTLVDRSMREFAERAKDPTATAIVHVNPIDNRSTVRGFLSGAGRKHRRNSLMLEAITGVFGDTVAVEQAKWSVAEHPGFFRTRLVFPKSQMENGGDPLHIGVDLLHSDIEHVADEVNMLLFRSICTNGAIATYGRKPYFKIDHRTSSVATYWPLMQGVTKILDQDRSGFENAVEKNKAISMDKGEALRELTYLHEEARRIPKAFAVKVGTAIEQSSTFANRWDFINALTAQARQHGDIARLRLETAAGDLLGLKFSEIVHDVEGMEHESN